MARDSKSTTEEARLSIVLSAKLRQKLKAKAALEGVSMRDAIIRLIEEYVEKKKKP
ncbi:hypothetical protein [Rickettsiella endosymbiont of Dermanyssus gallinae]|uniref:hypothetical protein n=1 Tax=Rickettsiella endosymbiont of Dermanyssus gallinae TaxID=2856608 RepID=UPI001C52B3C9|nr:hypothetical protein [Rickettsiella endosymbiont of Dermanyssus gallinae]